MSRTKLYLNEPCLSKQNSHKNLLIFPKIFAHMIMTTTITFLGTSGSTVTRKRACAGIFFEEKLLDIGFGVLTNLIKSDIGLDEIKELYVSHTHSDHIGDFTGLIWAMAVNGRTKPLNIVCSALTASSLKSILALQSTPRSGFIKFEINFKTPEKAKVSYRKTIHDPENLAYKFKVNQSSIVYTGDTAKCNVISKFAHGADLLIHDATFLSGQEAIAELTNHSTAEQAGQIAQNAQVNKLVMTHIAPVNEGSDRQYKAQAKRVFENEIIVAKDCLSLEI